MLAKGLQSANIAHKCAALPRLNNANSFSAREAREFHLGSEDVYSKRGVVIMLDDGSFVRPEIVRTDRRLAYKNRWMSVWEDQVIFPDGSVGIYGCVDKPDFALIVPFDGSGFYLVEQFRYPVEGRYWEFPQGSLESAPDLDVHEVAKQELREETGLSAKSLEVVGKLYEAYGFSNQGFSVFLATELTQRKSNPEVSEMGMTCRRFEPNEVWDLIRDGRLKDAPSIAALALVSRHLGITAI